MTIPVSTTPLTSVIGAFYCARRCPETSETDIPDKGDLPMLPAIIGPAIEVLASALVAAAVKKWLKESDNPTD